MSNERRKPSFGTPLLLSCLSFAAAIPTSAQVAGPEVYAALQEQPWVQVMVALRQAAPFDVDVERHSVSVAEIREGVLLGLDEKDFVATHTYRTLSAMAGRLSATGFVKLLRDPDVLRGPQAPAPRRAA